MIFKRPLLLVLVIAFLATLWVQWPRLQDPYQIEADFLVLHWMHRFDDQELFTNDPSFFSRISEVDLGPWHIIMDTGSPGFSWLFQAANQIIPFLIFSKLLIIPLTLIAVAYMYGIGNKIGGTKTAVVLSLTFLVLDLASSTSVSTTGGLQRSFIFPLLLGLIYHLMYKQYGAITIILVISGLVYPSAFVLGVVTTALTLIDWHSLKQRQLVINWKGVLYLGTAVAIVLIIFVPTLISQSHTSNELDQTPGEFYQLFNSGNEGHVLSNPLYQSGSRAQLFTIFPFVGRGGLAVRGISIIHITILAILALITIWLQPKSISETDRVLKCFFVGTWICFTAAWTAILVLSSFPLYLPSRYTEASLFLFLLIFVVTNGKNTLTSLTTLLIDKKQTAMWGILAISILLFAFAFLSLFSAEGEVVGIRSMIYLIMSLSVALTLLALYGMRQPATQYTSPKPPAPNKLLSILGLIGLGIISMIYIFLFQHTYFIPDHAERELFDYLETIPKDSKLSGAPNLLNAIPLFSKRQVVYSCVGPNFVPQIIQDSLSAYFAGPEEGQKIQNYCQEYDIDYWVIDSRHFNKETWEQYYCSLAPYDTEILPDLLNKETFYWTNYPEEQITFHQDYISVIPCH